VEVEKFPVSVDVRFPTRLVFVMEEEVRNVAVGQSYDLTVRLIQADDGSSIAYKQVDLYCNDVKVDSISTDANGIVVFERYAAEDGIYYYRAVFDTWGEIYRPSYLPYPNALTAGLHRSQANLDGQIRHGNIGGEYYYVDSTSTTARVGWTHGRTSYQEWNMYFSFDTSFVPDNATVTSATLKLKAASETLANNFSIDVYGGTQPIYGSVLDINDWNCGTAFQSTRSTSDVVVGQYMDWTIQPSQINKFGITQFEVKESDAYQSLVDFYTAEQGDASAPLLDIFYGYVENEEARLVVIAEVVPTVTYFDVRPRSFTPSTQITLNATVRNAASGQSIGAGTVVNFYKVDQSGTKTLMGLSETDPRGVALYSLVYSSEGSGPYAFIAEPNSPNVISSSGITLTVARSTTITLSIERDQSTYNHVISGNLRSEGVGIVGKQIEILVNDAPKATLMTATDGHFSIQLHLEPLNSNPTNYRIMASFEGDNTNAATATAHATTPNGTQYRVCTTNQYNYKPTQSCVTLTVQPPKTDVTAPAGNDPPTQSPEGTTVTIPPAKPPEQTQQEAQNRGWLSVWNEFMWWWPFYRIHFDVMLMSFSLRVAFNPILPGGEEMQLGGAESFSQLSADAIGEVRLDLFGLFAQYVIARLASSVNPVIAIITEVAKFLIQVNDLYQDWNDKIALLASSVINFLMAVIAIGGGFAEDFLLDICWVLVDTASAILRAVFIALLSVVSKAMVITKPLGGWLDAIEVVGDVALGILGLARWSGLL
jgi:hypothetical protein